LFELRAERLGEGSGRFYTGKYRATDLAGNTATSCAYVTVPHDASGRPAVLEQCL
jgi:hypothetical protein